MNLPVKPMPDDVIDLVAKEVAAQVRDHIQQMYPAAAEAVAWKSASLSIQGVVRNTMASAAYAAEEGTIELWLADKAHYRKRVAAAWRKSRAAPVRSGVDSAMMIHPQKG